MKWRLLDAIGYPSSGGVLDGSLSHLLLMPGMQAVNRVRVSSVKSKEANAELASIIQLALAVTPEFAGSQRACNGVTSAYLEAGALGVDRWMAMLAGRQLAGARAYVVVDAGSALTLDFVNERGMHQGGFIVPGLNLQLQSLLGGTAISFDGTLAWGGVAPGYNTEHAILNGILCMVCRWIVGEVLVHGGEEPRVLVTGGDAQVLSGELKTLGLRHEHVPELVMDGLRIALP